MNPLPVLNPLLKFSYIFTYFLPYLLTDSLTHKLADDVLFMQNSVIPNLLVCVLSCGANAALNYGLVYQANMGIK